MNSNDGNNGIITIAIVIVLTAALWAFYEFILKTNSLGNLFPWMLPWQ